MKNKRPNVLMICADQWPGGIMGCYGNENVMTPTLDNLAKNGIRFSQCVSTCPVCIPARRSLMTGTFPKTHGDRVYTDTMLMPNIKTLAQSFRDSGYQAYAVGKMHVYPQRNRIGFDDIILHEEGRTEFGVVDDYKQFLADKGHVGEEFLHGMSSNEYHTRPWHLSEELHPVTWTTHEMMRMMKRRDPLRPSLFYISHQFPHTPLVPLQYFLDMYDEDEIPVPSQGDWLDDSTIIKYLTEKDGVDYSTKEIKRARKAFYAMCTQLDFSIRSLIGTLREEGLLDNTIITFFTDHGDQLFEHGMTAKRTFYEGSTHVPLIITSPLLNEFRGEVRNEIVCLEDVMPTLLDLCGINIPETVEGKALLSKNHKPRKMLFGEVNDGVRATRMARSEDLKLIYYPCGNTIHLFDMKKDPNELHNLHNDINYKKQEKELIDFLIENLHGDDDLSWVKNGILIGYPEPEYINKRNYGMGNMRGLHFPQPPKLR
jgi:arylsulfatase A-like enzyme